MPRFDYECLRCGDAFEEDLGVYQEWITCHGCGQYTAQQVWREAPAMSPDRYWAGYVDPDVGYVTGRAELHQKMDDRGLRFKESGMDRDAEGRNRDIIEHFKQNQREKIKQHFGSMTIDEVRQQARNETLLHPSQPIVVNQNQPEDYPHEEYDDPRIAEVLAKRGI